MTQPLDNVMAALARTDAAQRCSLMSRGIFSDGRAVADVLAKNPTCQSKSSGRRGINLSVHCR